MCNDIGVLARFDRVLGQWHRRHRDASSDENRRPHNGQGPGDQCPGQKIKHIVILMMENHSYDNYLGASALGDGLTKGPSGEWGPTNKTSSGAVVHPFRLSSTAQQVGVPTQSWRASHIQFHHGANDGFVESIERTVPTGDPVVPMGFWTEADLPFYASLARTFSLADRWFSSLLGPTFPNRRFLIAGTANGLIDDLPAGIFDYPRSGSLFDLLDVYNISWADYHHARTSKVVAKRALGGPGLRACRRVHLAVGQVWPSLISVGSQDLEFTADLYPLGLWRCLRHLRPVGRFFDDARLGNLPAVSIVDPDFQTCSEENPQNVQIGEGFASAVINAVINGKGWPETLLIWLYDEHGGYFDHVVPCPAVPPDDVKPHSLLQSGGLLRFVLQRLGYWSKVEDIDRGDEGYDRYGFRVPAVIVSPYSKPGYVSSVVFDHTSILKLIESIWDLPPLTARDSLAHNPLDDMVDFGRAAFLTRPALSEPARPWRS